MNVCLRTISSLVASCALALPALAQKQTDPAAQRQAEFYSSSAWQQFLGENSGQWRVEWCAATGTPKAIWGSGVPLGDWRMNSLEEARRHAHLLLQQHAGMLGLGTSEFREIIGSRMGRTWVLVYDQFFRGLPVIGGRADVRVHMVGRVPMFGATAWQIPADFNVVPAFDAETATAIAWQALGGQPTGVAQPAPVAAPRLVIDGDVEATEQQTPTLAWEVAISNVAADGTGPIGRYYVDAKTGKVLRFVNDKHECGLAGCTIGKPKLPVPDLAMLRPGAELAAPPVLTTVTVMGWTRVGVDAFDPLVNTPIPGLVLNVPGIGNVTTDNNGQFTIDIAAAVSISVGALDGRHHGAIAGANAPSASVTVNPGVATTIQLLTAGASTAQAAHTTTSYWVDRVNEWSRSILGNSAELNTADAVATTVNIASTCNAYYTGNSINFYQAGGGCSNTSFSTVVAHEWGHGLDERYGGISQTNGLSEGWGDTLGCYLLDTPDLGSGFQTQGVALRSANNTTQYPCSGCGVHTAGQSWMGFAWKLRNQLATTLGSRPAAIALTEDIVVGSIAADATNQADAVLQVYIADDNDGNLANGTPHKPDLDWACNQHSLPIPGGGGPTAPANDECAAAVALVNGVNGPYTSIGATTSIAWPCASGGNDVWFSYIVGSVGNLAIDTCGQATWDTAIEIFSGNCGALTSVVCNDDSCSLQSSVTAAVAPGIYYIRVGGFSAATGTFSLNVNGPAGTPASTTPFGTACGAASKSFYELFASTGFDLGGVAMRLVKDAGGFYVAQSGGSYVAPSGAATSLTLTDDSVTTVTLAGAFPYFGGTTATLEVGSNGYVSVATGNGTGYTPTAAGWVNSAQPRWGTWHDFNPTLAGSGQVKFEQIGSIAYVTWDGVYSYATTAANTFQLQFDLGTGNVTFVWQTMVSSGNAWLVGYAGGGATTDIGSLDVSAALPGTFRTSADNAVPLALASTVPSLGSNLTFTTTNFPASSLLGIQILSTTRFDPGIDLSIIGMPGCFSFAALDALYLLFPVAQQASYTMAIPNNPVLMGFQMTGQSAAFVNGVNTAGLVASNGVAITVGI
ncbi:MAG: PepSY domain-containing protein [Planctomycetes bacterium]|nr:PepSY domain-containing protein [Planctomycetota bacterium]